MDEVDGSGSCNGCGAQEFAFDWRRERAVDEWRESAAEVRLETAGLGGAGRDEVSESRFDELLNAAATAALSEIGVSEASGGSGMVIWVVGVLIWKMDPGVGVVGDTADMLTDKGGGLSVPVGVIEPSPCAIFSVSLSLSSGESRVPLRLLEDEGRNANSCAPRRGGG